MTIEELGSVLGVAAAFDNRTVGKADILAWHSVIGHLNATEAREAVIAHYTETTDRIMPAHVLARVTKLRALRIAHAGPESVPDADPDDVEAYQKALREGRYVTASGLKPRPVRQAIESAFCRVESHWNRAAIAAPAPLPPAEFEQDPDLAAALAVLKDAGNVHALMIAARAELETEGALLDRRAVAIRAADVATRPEAGQS